MIIWLVCFSAVAWTATKCEPPVNSYLPPTRGGAGGNPSAEYGPPGTGGSPPSQINSLNRPGNSNQPQDSYSLSGQFPPNAPNSQYGPPETGRVRSQQKGLGSPPQRPGQRFGGGSPRQGFGGTSSGQGFLSSSPGREFSSSNQPSQEYGAPNQFGTRNEGNNQNRLGNRPLGGSSGRTQNNLPTSYGLPNQQISGEPFGATDAPFGQDSLRSNKRPDTSYGAPLVGGSSRGQGNNLGASKNSQRPASSYGPPPFGDVSGSGNDGNGDFGQGQQNSRQRNPDSSYGTPNSVGGGAGSRYQDGSNDESNEPAKYEFNYDVDNSQTGTKFGHSEQRDGDVTTGEYNVVLPDGRKQVVEYEAGLQGYKPQIRYEGSAMDNSGFGAGGNQAVGQGYPQGSNANKFQDSSNDLGYPQNTQDEQNRYQQQPADVASGYPRGGLGGMRGQEQTVSGYSRGSSNGADGNIFGSAASGYPGHQGGANLIGSFDSDNGYPRGGPQGSGFSSEGPQSGSSGYPRGLEGNQSYPKGGPSQGSNSSGRGGQNRGSFPEDSSSGRNNYPGNSGGQGSGNRSFGKGNDGDQSGYPSGGPDGPRGSGF